MNRREFLKKSLGGIVVAGIPFIGCSKNPVNSEFGRIIPWESIDGVNLGDTPDAVNKKLGLYDENFNWDGIYSGGMVYDYNDGFHAGLRVFIGDADYVDDISVKSPYTGKTKEGIGIGSSLASVHDVYGVPDKTHSINDTTRSETYYSDNSGFNIYYEDSNVRRIGINIRHQT